jgi:hypothetical protein
MKRFAFLTLACALFAMAGCGTQTTGPDASNPVPRTANKPITTDQDLRDNRPANPAGGPIDTNPPQNPAGPAAPQPTNPTAPQPNP